MFFIVQGSKKLLPCTFFWFSPLGGNYENLDPTNPATDPLLVAKNPVTSAHRRHGQNVSVLNPSFAKTTLLLLCCKLQKMADAGVRVTKVQEENENASSDYRFSLAYPGPNSKPHGSQAHLWRTFRVIYTE